MILKIDAFLKAVFLLALLGGAVGLAIKDVSKPAHAFCGAMKKDPQPNHANADCT